MRIFARHKHISKGILSEYLDGRLDTAARHRVELHLPACDACQEELDSLRATSLLLRQLPVIAPRRSFVMSKAPAPVIERRESRRLPLPLRAPQWAYAGAAATAVLALTVLISVDAVGVLAPDKGPGSGDLTRVSVGQDEEAGLSPTAGPAAAEIDTGAPPARADSAPAATVAPADAIREEKGLLAVSAAPPDGTVLPRAVPAPKASPTSVPPGAYGFAPETSTAATRVQVSSPRSTEPEDNGTSTPPPPTPEPAPGTGAGSTGGTTPGAGADPAAVNTPYGQVETPLPRRLPETRPLDDQTARSQPEADKTNGAPESEGVGGPPSVGVAAEFPEASQEGTGLAWRVLEFIVGTLALLLVAGLVLKSRFSRPGRNLP